MGQIVSATEQAKLSHDVWDPSKDVEIVPAMLETLLSVGQFADAWYVTIFDDQTVKIYDGKILCQMRRWWEGGEIQHQDCIVYP